MAISCMAKKELKLGLKLRAKTKRSNKGPDFVFGRKLNNNFQ